MNVEKRRRFELELEKRAKRVQEYLLSKAEESAFAPAEIKEAVCDYFQHGGKKLRPGVLLFSCGAVGGDEQQAIPAAAAVEAFHTWTLVHDDIIDRDDKRRGQVTVHHKFFQKALKDSDFHGELEEAKHYGLSVGLLTGDVQHGWSISLLTELSTTFQVNPYVSLLLIKNLDSYVLNTLVEGEMLDILYAKKSIESLDENLILQMLWKKTGALYEFAGRAGAMIGLNLPDPTHPLTQAISAFTNRCGVAFQLQDDILGITGDETKLGKPVGSDVREGKKTLIVYYAFKNATAKEKKRLSSILGNEAASSSEIAEARELLMRLGGVEKTRVLAHQYVQEALRFIEMVPASEYKDLLCAWAEFLISRDF